MRGLLVLALVSCSGCGRIGFDPVPGGARLDDAPAVPASICKVTQVAAPTPAIADLAITATDEGYTAIWVDTQQGGTAHGVRLAADHQPLAASELKYLTDTRLAGVLDTGSALMIVSATGTVETARSVSPDLATQLGMITRTDQVPSRDPFATNTANTTRLLVFASVGEIELAYVNDDGTLVPKMGGTVRQQKLEIACTYGPDHGHCVWTQEPDSAGGPTRCASADMKFTDPPTVSSDLFEYDCNALRTAPGANAEHPIAVWTTATGRLMGRYLKGPSTVEIAASGSAPKVQYDGARFWIAWLDPSGVLQLTSFDEDSSFVTYPMPGWVPNGAEAFEVVRRVSDPAGTTVELVLAVLRSGELDFLTICPP